LETSQTNSYPPGLCCTFQSDTFLLALPVLRNKHKIKWFDAMCSKTVTVYLFSLPEVAWLLL